MNKKQIIIAIVAVVVIFILYRMMTHHAPKAPPAQPVPEVKPKPQASAAPAVPVESEDQKLIDQYSSDIAAGNIDNGNAYFKRGMVYLKLQQNRLAIGDFTAALKISPKSPYLFYNRALAYRQENQLDAAISDLNAAIQNKADFVDAYNTRALVYVDQQDYNDALADYNQAIKLNPKFAQAYYNLGTLYTRENKYDDAKKAFTQAITLNVPPANAKPEEIAAAKRNLGEAYLSRANAEMENGDLKEALADATYVVTNYPQSVQALRVRSAIYNKMGNSAAATADSAAADSLSLQNMMNNK